MPEGVPGFKTEDRKEEMTTNPPNTSKYWNQKAIGQKDKRKDV